MITTVYFYVPTYHIKVVQLKIHDTTTNITTTTIELTHKHTKLVNFSHKSMKSLSRGVHVQLTNELSSLISFQDQLLSKKHCPQNNSFNRSIGDNEVFLKMTKTKLFFVSIFR